MSHGAKEKVLVVCPGRGTYTKRELGYLKKYRPGIEDFVSALDEKLAANGRATVTELDDAPRFSLKTHTPGENASTLIYACSMADFMAMDRERYEVVAVTGNSMGWYTALAAAGALNEDAAFTVIHTMGSMMAGGVIGGQIIYPVVDDQWRFDPQKLKTLDETVRRVIDGGAGPVYPSIYFGGYRILGGEESALKALMKELPAVGERYPFQLVNHAAFHTPLMHGVSERAFATLGSDLFQKPEVPLVDGRGVIWTPYATDREALRSYTLGHQVYEPYDFTSAVTVGLKEFAPTKVVLLGPGATSGGAIAQAMIQNGWRGLACKDDFTRLQENDPYLLAMGREDQWSRVVEKRSLVAASGAENAAGPR